jgi:hypothetical protein
MRGKFVMLLVIAAAGVAFFLFPFKSKLVTYLVGNCGVTEATAKEFEYMYLRAWVNAHKAKELEFTFQGKYYSSLTGRFIR